MQKQISMMQWVWKAYWRSALIPLLLVELVFIGIYFASGYWSTNKNIETLKNNAIEEMQRISSMETEEIYYQLSSVENATTLYQKQTENAFNKQASLNVEDSSRLAYNPDGIYYSQRNRTSNDGAAFFYSGIMPIGEEERAKVARLAGTQEIMKDIKDSEPLAVAVYFNTFDSFNIIYPYFDVLTQYAPKMNIPSFNFYYEADAAHNPQKTIRWTDAYVDPAGNGWMVSCIAPVYSNNNLLEGVVGIDITISTIVKYILDLNIPWQGYAMLIGRDGKIIALPKQGEEDFSLQELTQYTYDQAITQEIFKPEQFNLYKRTDLPDFSQAVLNNKTGVQEITLNNKKYLAAWSTVPNTGWHTITLASEDNIFAKIYALQNDLKNIGYKMILGLLLFYLIFFAYLYRMAKRRCVYIAETLGTLKTMADNIGDGEYEQHLPDIFVKEIKSMAISLQKMGYKLGEMTQNLFISKTIAEKASKAKSDFLSRMSHELRTPLNSIMGFTNILRSDSTLPYNDEQRDNLEQIAIAGKNLHELINEILEMSSIEAGEIKLIFEYVPLKELIEDCVAQTFPIAEKHKIALINRCSIEQSVLVKADKKRLRQVIINLIINAILYNKENGQVLIHCTQKENILSINVDDTGIGIDNEQLDAIFMLFYRVENTEKTIPGSGVGLTIAKQLVNLMHGKITAESTLSQGSTFSVELPFTKEESAPTKPNSSHNAYDDSGLSVLDGQRVLIVEDNKANQKLLMLMLKKWKIVSVIANNGQEAVDILKTGEEFAAILMDCNMPILDGYQATIAIRSWESEQNIRHHKILAVTANALDADEQKCFDVGMDAFLSKPISPDKLKHELIDAICKTSDSF